MTLTLNDLTAKRPYGWFAVKQDLSPRMKWARNVGASFARQNGPRIGDTTDRFFRRNNLSWIVGVARYSGIQGAQYIQLVGAPTVGEVSTHAIDTLRSHCNEDEFGEWKIYVVNALAYLTGGLNNTTHVRCIVSIP